MILLKQVRKWGQRVLRFVQTVSYAVVAGYGDWPIDGNRN